MFREVLISFICKACQRGLSCMSGLAACRLEVGCTSIFSVNENIKIFLVNQGYSSMTF